MASPLRLLRAAALVGALLQLLLCNSAAAAPASNAPRRTAGWPARDALLLRRPPRASSAASPGPSDRRNLRALVLRVSLPSTCAPLYARRPTATAQDWLAILRELNSFLGACTAWAISFNVTAARVADVSVPCIPSSSVDACDEEVTGAWERAAAAEARRRGLPLDAADHVFYDLPRRPCFWAGMAYIYGKDLMLNNLGDSPRPVGTLAHELGHNFGLPHPDTLSPSRLPATGPPAAGDLGGDDSAVLDTSGRACYLLPQLAANMQLATPRVVGAGALVPGRVLGYTLRPYWAAMTTGLVINPSGWDSARSKWRIWVSYSDSHGFGLPLPEPPTKYAGAALVHLTNADWTYSGTQRSYRLAVLLEGEAVTLAPLGLVIRLQRLSRTTAGASAVVQLCRQTAATRCQGMSSVSVARAAAQSFQLRLPRWGGGACLRACGTQGCLGGLATGAGAPKNAYFDPACGTGPAWSWRPYKLSNGYSRYRNNATGQCLTVTRGTNLGDGGYPRPRLVVATCNRTSAWDSGGDQQLFVERRGSATGAAAFRLSSAALHPAWAEAGCVEACDKPSCIGGLPAGAGAATLGYCWGDDQAPAELLNALPLP